MSNQSTSSMLCQISPKQLTLRRMMNSGVEDFNLWRSILIKMPRRKGRRTSKEQSWFIKCRKRSIWLNKICKIWELKTCRRLKMLSREHWSKMKNKRKKIKLKDKRNHSWKAKTKTSSFLKEEKNDITHMFGNLNNDV